MVAGLPAYAAAHPILLPFMAPAPACAPLRSPLWCDAMISPRSLYVLSGLALLALGCEGDSSGREDDDDGMAEDGIDVPEPVDPPPSDPGEYLKGIDAEFMAAADEFGVPSEILKAVGFTESQWQTAGEDYFEKYDHLGTGPEARGPAYLQIAEVPGEWTVTQILEDPDGDRDWRLTAALDLAATDEAGEPVFTAMDLAPWE